MEDSLTLGMLVELKDQYSNVYPTSPTGARAWVRRRREDPGVDPEIYVEWDKTHWRYHGERDGWTFAHHFQPVGANEIFDHEQLDAADFIKEAERRLDAERCPDCGEIHGDADDYLATLAAGSEAALQGEAFLMITLGGEARDGVTLYQPRVWARALNDTAREMIEAQIVDLASQLLQDHATDRAQAVTRKGLL